MARTITADGEYCQTYENLVNWFKFISISKYFRICPDYCANEFNTHSLILDESSIPIEFEEEIITMTEQIPESTIRKPKVSAPPPKSLNAHRPMNFAHAMKLFKNMQKRKAQASAREKHKIKKVKEKPPQKPLIQVATKKRDDSSSYPKSSSSKTVSKSSSRKKKHKAKKNSKSVNSSKLASVPKVEEDEIEIDIVDV